jgi:hypothetical protein
MSHGDIDELRKRVDNIAAIDNEVLTAKAVQLLDRLIDQWANWESEQVEEQATLTG